MFRINMSATLRTQMATLNLQLDMYSLVKIIIFIEVEYGDDQFDSDESDAVQIGLCCYFESTGDYTKMTAKFYNV